MTQLQNRSTIQGSDRGRPLHGSRILGPVPAEERFEVTVRVKRRTDLASLADHRFQSDGPPTRRRYLTRDEYANSHGADPADLAKVAVYAKACNLVVVDSDPARRSVFLSGTGHDMAQAFGT